MYFSFFKLKKWGKKTAETRRRNCAVLPFPKRRRNPRRRFFAPFPPEHPS